MIAASEPFEPRIALVTVPAGAIMHDSPDTRAFATGLRDLIGMLPERAQLLIGCHRRCLHKVSEWVRGRTPAAIVVPLDDALDFSLWSQDTCLAASDGSTGEFVFLATDAAKRKPDMIAVEALAAAAGIGLRRIALGFESGDVLVGDDFVLVGADTQANLGPFADGRRMISVGTSRAVPTRSLRLSTAGGVLWIDELFAGTGRRQPIFHLDMFVSLAGRSPGGRYRVLLGDPRIAAAIIGDRRLDQLSDALASCFDEIADDLRHQDFDVIRNPLPLIFFEEARLLAWSRASVAREFHGVDGVDQALAEMRKRSERRVGVRRWYFATQNNAVAFQTKRDGNVVLLPTYAYGRWQCLEACERRNAEIWSDLGYRVVALPDFNVFARRHGSARCLVKLF